MRFRLPALAIILGTAGWAIAIQESDAGVIDWHKSLVGIPLADSLSTAPVFHRTVSGRNSDSKIVVATKKNTLAGVDPATGDTAWRHVFDDADHIISVRSNKHIVTSLSGPGGSYARAFEVQTGNLLWELPLHPSKLGYITQPSDLGVHIAFPDDETADVIVLTNAHTLRRITAQGNIKWEWNSPDQGSLVLQSRVVTTPTAVHVIGVASSFASYTLHATILDPMTGLESGSFHVPSKVHGGVNDFVILDRQPTPYLVWLEGGSVKSIPLTPASKAPSPAITKEKDFESISDIGLGVNGMFVALKSDGTSHVIRVGEETDGKVPKIIWEFADSATSEEISSSLFSGGFDKHGKPYVARIYYHFGRKAATLNLLAPNGAPEGKGMVTGYTFPFDTVTHGVILHVAIDVANPSDFTYITRGVVTTSTGSVQLWQGDVLKWTREESLTEIKSVELLDLPEREVLSSVVAGEESFVGKLVRQAVELQNFPSYVIRFVNRFLTGNYETATSSLETGKPGALYRDTFGFHKVLVVATSTGKLFGIDTSRGAIIWSRIIGHSGPNGPDLRDPKVLVYSTVWEKDGRPEILVVAQRSVGAVSDTVSYHIDALTGKNKANSLIPGVLFSGPLQEIFLLRDANKTLLAVDHNTKIHVFPETPATLDALQTLAPRLHFHLKTGPPDHERLTGYKLVTSIDASEDSSPFGAVTTWSLSLPPSESIQEVVRPPRDAPIASFGKVLGDRSTLYKYLNPHLLVVITSDSDNHHWAIYLVDGTTGTTVYHTRVNAIGPIHAALSENWLVYTYFGDNLANATDSAKGHQVVTVELYEGAARDDKTNSPEVSSFTYDSAHLHALHQSFVFPHGVTALGITSTKFGISTKELIVANNLNQIQTFPRRFLDPRRHKNKPSTEDQEEMLIPYDPVIPDDVRHVISHRNEVLGARHIFTSPSLLESTSLVFVYGGTDLFFTRTSPSGTFDVLSETFNKVQLVLTVFGLTIAIFITKPIVGSKLLKQRWYA